MQTFTANEAKTRFGQLLLQAQNAPVQISKNGQPVAVMLSNETYNALEELKMQMLRARATAAQQQIADGEVSDGDVFMRNLIAGQFDK